MKQGMKKAALVIFTVDSQHIRDETATYSVTHRMRKSYFSKLEYVVKSIKT